MNKKWINFFLTLGASVALAVTSASSFGQTTVVVDDNVVVDGTGSLDAQYFPSSSPSALEINANSIGLVSGSSGRAMHAIFPAVTLTDIGDSITLNYTFMTPMTIGSNEDNAFRFGLFDTLGRETPVLIPDPNDPTMMIQEVIDGVPQTEGVFGATSYSTANPNILYGDVNDGNPSALPGFSASYDHLDDAPGVIDDEVQIRQAALDFPSGRFIGTTGGFGIIGSLDAVDSAGLAISGFAPLTTYSGTFTIERTSATEVTVSTSIDLPGFTDPMTGEPLVLSTTDLVEDMTGELVAPDPVVADSFTFDMIGFGGSSAAWGTSNTVGADDNGLDFLSIQIVTTGDVEQTSLPGDFDGNGVVDCADLDGYVGNLGTAATGALAALDLDGSGFLEAADADTHITTLVVTQPNGVTGTFPGDVNCDGQVNVLGDAFALVASLGGTATSYSQGDLNFDGQVNVLGDAFVLVANLGMSNDP